MSRELTVFCGSRDGARPTYRAAALAFGTAMARRGFDLVYGGGQNGLMGAVADAVLAGGRRVIGVIPKGLDRIEFAHRGLSERIDVDTMHARKAVMAERGVAFVALPGGFGTMDELFEALTLIQTQKIARFPIILVGTKYWQGLMDWIKATMDERYHYVNPVDMELFSVVDKAEDAVAAIDRFYSKYMLKPNF